MNTSKCLLLPLVVAALAGDAGTFATRANSPPTLNALSDVVINEDAGNQTVPLSGIGPGAPGENQTLTITALSSNPSLIPNPTITYISPDANGSLTFTPVANAFGTTVITVIVNDGQPSDHTVTRSFSVTVIPVNDLPAISIIANQTINENTSAGPIPFTVADVETSASALIVSGNSSNPSLVPATNLVFAGSGANRTLTVIPAPNRFGTATITVVVSDSAGGTVSRAFAMTVNPVSPPVIDRLERDGDSIRFHLTGPPLYDYTVEFTDSMSPANWLALTSYRAKIAALDVMVTNSLTSAQARFFRVRQEFCYCRNE